MTAQGTMKRLPRNPVKFDIFAAFAQFAATHGLSIRDPQALERFKDAVLDETERSLDNNIFVYGFRVQTMFETVVAALGDVKMIKQEDAGNAYLTGDFEVPDYRLVLQDGKQILVEVKNYNQKHAFDAFEQDVAYLQRLEAYAALTGAELLVAVYWLKWNMWTLVSPRAFVPDGDVAKLELGAAMKTNQMRRLGDHMIATRSPLRFRIEVDELSRDGDERQLVIKQIDMYCDEQHLVNPVERKIASAIMFHGSWRERELLEECDSKLVAIEYQYAPDEEMRFQEEQGFDIVGAVSSIVSKFYRQGTAQDGAVHGFHVDFTPGEFGRLIPKDYFEREHALRLWRFELQHAES